MAGVPTRGIRNNNPGNIRRSDDDWQGLSPTQTDSAFFQFTKAFYGIRAVARIFAEYQRIHNLRTVRTTISRWAPPSENKTKAYVAYVAAQTGFSPDHVINLENPDSLAAVVEAVIQYENDGQQPYTETLVDAAVEDALEFGPQKDEST